MAVVAPRKLASLISGSHPSVIAVTVKGTLENFPGGAIRRGLTSYRPGAGLSHKIRYKPLYGVSLCFCSPG